MAPESVICPECGQPLKLAARRAGSLTVCPWCSRAVSIKSQAAQAPESLVRGAPRPETLGAQRRPAATALWIVEGRDGLRSEPISKAELDEHALSGRLDGCARVKRQDWLEAKNAAELYQGLAVPCSQSQAEQSESPFRGEAPAAPPWSAPPEPPPLPPPAPPPVRRVNPVKIVKIVLLVVGALGGFLAFGSALGSPFLNPLYSRQVLFWLFAFYWFGMLLAAIGLFGWQPQQLFQEPEAPPLPPLPLSARHAVGGFGLAVMAAVLWAIR